jgi:hypothetical protein
MVLVHGAAFWRAVLHWSTVLTVDFSMTYAPGTHF